MTYPELRNRARFGLPLAALATALLLSACSESPQPTLVDAEGNALPWQDLRGDWVFVNYWAEWCLPCLEEIPELNALNGRPGIRVLGVNFDGIQGDELLELGQRMDIRFTMLADNPAAELGWSAPVALPATYVVTPAGRLQEVRFGPQHEADLLNLTR
ncbi:MAG: TlpA family protein disulfide reductase [Marinobacter sp.]|nr:TlpA family protein disulfide reductase [Marinobacter sp.]